MHFRDTCISSSVISRFPSILDIHITMQYDMHVTHVYILFILALSQGIGVCLGEIFHWIEARQKLLTVSQSALSWVHRRCPQLTESAMYIVEPSCDSTSKCSYNLRCMLTTSGPNTQSPSSKLLVHEDNVFQDYLFQCVDNSEPVVANAYGQHHLGYPIRDSTGCAVAVLDLYMPPTQELRPGQVREVTKVLKLLTLAFYELSCVQERPTTTAGSSSK